MNLHDFKDQLITAVATAAILGGGGTLISTRVELGRHDERIERIETLTQEMSELRRELADTRVSLAEIKGNPNEPEAGVR